MVEKNGESTSRINGEDPRRSVFSIRTMLEKNGESTSRINGEDPRRSVFEKRTIKNNA